MVHHGTFIFFKNYFSPFVPASLGQQPNKIIINKELKFRSDVSQNKKMCKTVDPLSLLLLNKQLRFKLIKTVKLELNNAKELDLH